MNFEFLPELQTELLDDFYAECDELLAVMRDRLVRLERALAHHTTDDDSVETVYRSLHSFKGNAALVSLRPAEQLAHQAETFLRRLSKHEISLTGSGLHALFHAVEKLEEIVSRHRHKQPLPETGEALAQLSAAEAASDASASGAETTFLFADQTAPTTIPAPAEDLLANAQHRGLALWRCTFTPAKEREARGITLQVVRERLSAAGEILRATPIITPGAGIAFEFVVGFREPPSSADVWADDGMRLSPLENEPVAAISSEAAPPSAATKSDLSATSATAAPRCAAAPVSMAESDDEFPNPARLSVSPSHIVRVDLGRLDELMRIAGELVIHRSRLEERLNRAVGAAPDDRTGLHEVNHSLGRSLRDLRRAISRVRMVSVAEIFTRLPFVVRDLSRETGRQARLLIEGQQTEIDKYLVERLKEPLLHLVRNAFTHGVESPEQRVAAGKPAEATIRLRATVEGPMVIIQIRDDGRGLNRADIARRAAAAELAVPGELDDAAMLDLLCAPGFSTRDEADRAAGRGLGMAVVRTTVRELGGSLQLASEFGAGTEFTLRLPLTLSIINVLLVACGDQLCALPQSHAEEIVQVPASEIRLVQQVEVMPHRDGLLPLTRLGRLFNSASVAAPLLTVVVIHTGHGSAGLAVDRIVGQREVVVRPMVDPLVQVPGISGATELGDGRPILILDPVAVAGTARLVRPSGRSGAAGAKAASAPRTPPSSSA